MAFDGARDLDRRIAEAIAVQVVALVREELGLPPAEDWIDAREVARRFGLSRAWVHAHARALGAVPIGSGPRPRLRFDPQVVADVLRTSGRQAGRRSVAKATTMPRTTSAIRPRACIAP